MEIGKLRPREEDFCKIMQAILCRSEIWCIIINISNWGLERGQPDEMPVACRFSARGRYAMQGKYAVGMKSVPYNRHTYILTVEAGYVEATRSKIIRKELRTYPPVKPCRHGGILPCVLRELIDYA